MSPRQFFAHLELERERHHQCLATDLMIAVLGTRGTEEAVQEQMDEWTSEG